MIPFNKVIASEKIKEHIIRSLDNDIMRGDGPYCKQCASWIEKKFNIHKAMLTGSCSHSLEMAAILCNIQSGDEVIMPSFTFCSTANAFALRGAKIVFVDIRPDTMNIDENLIEAAITDKTKAIVPVHYAGVGCEMDIIMDIATKHNLYVVEDAAQGVMSNYKGKALGTIGHIGCYSFHETKNYSMGEGGATLINDDQLIERGEIIREKGTNRSQFLRGQIDKYSWVDIGSSYLPSELSAAYLFGQLEIAEAINEDRLNSWHKYYELLKPLADMERISLPYVPEECKHNAHMFYIKVKDIEERTELISFLKSNGITSLFHYVPLHSSIAGKKYGMFNGVDKYTTNESNRLLRLPMFYGLELSMIKRVTDKVKEFYNTRK